MIIPKTVEYNESSTEFLIAYVKNLLLKTTT